MPKVWLDTPQSAEPYGVPPPLWFNRCNLLATLLLLAYSHRQIGWDGVQGLRREFDMSAQPNSA